MNVLNSEQGGSVCHVYACKDDGRTARRIKEWNTHMHCMYCSSEHTYVQYIPTSVQSCESHVIIV